MSDILAPPEPGDLSRPLPGDPSKPYNPPLSKASVEGRLDDVKKMVNSGQHDINEIDVGWSTPLHRACWEGHAEVVKFLLDAKADVTMINISHKTPMDYARELSHKGNDEIMEIMGDAPMHLYVEGTGRFPGDGLP